MIGKYRIKDMEHTAIARPAFWCMKKLYLRPGSVNYESNYMPFSRRSALITRKALREAKTAGYDYGLSKVLTRLLRSLGAKDDVQFFYVQDMDDNLRNANLRDVKQQFRGIGLEFCKSITGLGLGDFGIAERSFMNAQDLALGARHENEGRLERGKVVYKYKKIEWPFRAEHSPSEEASGSFLSGASTILHGNSEKPRDMSVLIRHCGDDVYFYCADRSWFEKKYPAVNPELL